MCVLCNCGEHARIQTIWEKDVNGLESKDIEPPITFAVKILPTIRITITLLKKSDFL